MSVATKKIAVDDFAEMDGRFDQDLEVARALDRRERIPYSDMVEILDMDTFIEVMTVKRFEILKLAEASSRSIKDLASATNRDPSAVSKDVAKLVGLGFVKVEAATNAGHGIKKIVKAVGDGWHFKFAESVQ